MSANTGTQTFGLDEDADVSDFMNRFSDPDTYVAPDEVNQRFDRFANAGHPEFQRAAGTYISQMDPSQFTQAAQNMEPQQRAGFAGGLLGSLQKMLGLDASSLGEKVGLSSTDPQRMGAQDIGRLAGYAQQNAPGALQQTAREQPFLLKALGNPLVVGAIAAMAARYLSKRSRQT